MFDTIDLYPISGNMFLPSTNSYIDNYFRRMRREIFRDRIYGLIDSHARQENIVLLLGNTGKYIL